MATRHEIDVIALQEIHLEEDQQFTWDGYVTTVTTEEEAPAFFKRTIGYSETLPPRDLENTEATCIEVS